MEAIRWHGAYNSASKPQRVECNDRNLWVCKLANAAGANQNAFNLAGMAIDFFGNLLATEMGVQCSNVGLVHFSEQFVALTPQLSGFIHGLALGSQYLGLIAPVTSASDVLRSRNKDHVAGILAVDLWLNNWDRSGNQGNTCIVQQGTSVCVIPIDYGVSFTRRGQLFRSSDLGPMSNEWLDLEAELKAPVYAALAPAIEGTDPFGEVLAKIEVVSQSELNDIWGEVPAEWLSETDRTSINSYLLGRASSVRHQLIQRRSFFLNWRV